MKTRSPRAKKTQILARTELSENRAKFYERKLRTRRLIVLGAALESYFKKNPLKRNSILKMIWGFMSDKDRKFYISYVSTMMKSFSYTE